MGSYFEDRMAELTTGKAEPRRRWYLDGARARKQPVPPVGKIGYIYFAVAGKHVKIGFAKDLGSRMETLQIGNHQEITVHESFTSYQKAEKMLHRHFKADRVRGEWFKWTSDIEELWDDILDYQGMHTPHGEDGQDSGVEYLARMPKTFIPLDHLQKILDYLNKPWPSGLFS